MRLVLWDIDGTILSAGRISKVLLNAAFLEAVGEAVEVEDYSYSGKTDPQIARELLLRHGVAEGEVEELAARALRVYEEQLCREISMDDVRLKPGIVEVLEALEADDGVALGLLTGNLESCARAKLRPPDLNRFFGFGVYGSDHSDRYELPPLALAVAAAELGRAFSGSDVVIVGDSIHDVGCGRSLGVRSVAVATGVTPRSELARADPGALLDDFGDLEAGLAAILG